MTTTRRNHLTISHDRSPFIAERRRKLFPIDDHDVDSDLGHISPLCSDTTSGSDNEEVTSISHYDVVGIVENKKVHGNETPVSNKAYSETMSPLKLSPYTGNIARDTPKKFSPSQHWKTPHDTSVKPVLQKEQKTLLEESKSLKRKSSPSSTPEHNKSMKIDSKNSRVRTALFPPEDEIFTSLPTKSFYSKTQENILEKLTLNRDKYAAKPIKFTTVKHSYKHKKKFGQINNGVGHKIRRPKQKKMSKAVINRATKKMLETGSVLNDYIKDLAELRNRQNKENKLIINPTAVRDKKPSEEPIEDPHLNSYLNDVIKLQTTKQLISAPLKQIQTFPEENKENIQIESRQGSVSPLSSSSAEETKSRKFFKCSRGRINNKVEKLPEKTLNLNTRIVDNVDNTKTFILPTKESHNVVNKITLVSNNDFEDDDMEPQANIDNILSVLSHDIPQKRTDNQNGLRLVKSNDCQDDVHNHGHILSELAVCHVENEIFDNTKSNSEVSMPTGSEIVDTEQYLYTNNNAIDRNSHLVTSNLENNVNLMKESHKDNVSTVNGQSGFKEVNIDVNLPTVVNIVYDSTLEPNIVSSQVVFDNILLEDENQSLTNNSSSQNGPFVAVSNDINHQKTVKIPNKSNEIILEAYNSVLASENSIQLHQSNVANMILSPISQMCNVTSGLALNSPKKGRNLTSLLNNMSRASKILSFNNSNSIDMEQQQKLFPLFYPGARGAPVRGEKRERSELKRSAKKFKPLPEDQMLLDAGQKNFGYTICNECNIVYHMGDPGDEIAHMNYHNASNILRFAGWKNEHVVADFHKNGRIIRVLPTDSKMWLKKVKDLIDFVKRDLGCYEMEYDISGSQVYLYIKNRTIAGCAVATTPKEGGHRMLSTLNGVAMCSEESYPIKCGISHIWVAANFRKQGVATALMNAVKTNFIYGYILTNTDIAMTSPTEAGSAFAEKYFQTSNYLVYYT